MKGIKIGDVFTSCIDWGQEEEEFFIPGQQRSLLTVLVQTKRLRIWYSAMASFQAARWSSSNAP